MTRPEFWVSVTCTDRATSLRALAGDLVAQARTAGLALALLVHDNSVRPTEAHAIRDLATRLRRANVEIEVVDAPVRGASIAASRRRQREQLRARLAARPRPAFVWMLDDDVRLDHLHWTGTVVARRPLHDHVTFLSQLSARHADLAVLIGEVCGDAPIPVFGSVVSRLVDLEANLAAMFDADPGAPWTITRDVIARLGEPDSYYDLSHAHPHDSPPWQRPLPWLPRGAPLDTAEALAQMLAEVEHIPRGSAFSRPILATAERFALLVPRPVRGGNAVFFDVDACLEHEYPSVIIDGIETRRGDMIGTARLAERGVAVMGSGFSVLHHRARDAAWPGADDLATSLAADTVGAALARAGDGRGDAGFLLARLARVEAAARVIRDLVPRLRQLVARAPSWADGLDPVLAVGEWALASFPGARNGVLPQELVARLVAVGARDDRAPSERRSPGERAA